MLEQWAGLAVLAMLLMMTTSGSAQAPEREYPPTVLRDVPRAGYEIHLCPFPGSLYACLEYLGDPQDYHYLMGVTGAAFRRIWNRHDGGNVDLMYLSPEPHRRAFEALGYEFLTVPVDKKRMVEAVKRSIVAGRPLLSFGIIGPPEAGIVTGYGKDGDVLYGWSYFQEDADRGYYELEGWFEKLSQGPPFGLIVIGEHSADPATPEEVLVASLEWAIDLAHRAKRPGLPEHICGLAAYDAWADALEVDADYPAEDQKTLETRAMVHCDQVVMLHERQSAAKYLQQMAESVPRVAEELTRAGALYHEVGQLAGEVWRWGAWSQPEAQAGLADSQTRREFAQSIRAARTLEAKAVEHLEGALAEMRGDQNAPVTLSHLELEPSKLAYHPDEVRPQIECMTGPGLLRALMEFLGEDFGYSVSEDGNWRTNEAFPMFMGVFGEAFEFVWLKRQDAPADDDSPPVVGDLSRRFAAALDAAGFDCEVLLSPGATYTRDALRRRVVSSIIDRGWPVMLFDVPAPGFGFLATGYAGAGDVLIGWSVEGGDDRGIRFEPEARSTVADWSDKAWAIVLLTDKHDRRDERAAYQEALERGLEFLTMRRAGTYHAGPATFDAWAKQLEAPSLDSEDDLIVKQRNRILDPMIWDLATRRHYGQIFLRRAAELFPAAGQDLIAAADCFSAEHDMMWQVNRVGGAQFPGDGFPKLGDPQVRREIIQILLKARDSDLQAAAHLEKALERLGVRQ